MSWLRSFAIKFIIAILAPLGIVHGVLRAIAHVTLGKRQALRVFGSRVEWYYESLTRDSLRDGFRTDLLDLHENIGNGLVEELRQALGGRNRLSTVFRTFAYHHHEEYGISVWREQEFLKFLASRLPDAKHSQIGHILWRSFYYSALFPFPSSPSVSEGCLSQEDWTQAVAILAARATASRNRSIMYLYGGINSSVRPKGVGWHRFRSTAVWQRREIVRDVKSTDQPSRTLLDVASIARSQLPVEYVVRVFRLDEVLPHVKKLLTDSETRCQHSDEFVIPYTGLQALIAATLQVTVTQLPSTRPGQRILECKLDPFDPSLSLASATAMLRAAGIRPGYPVAFEQFSKLLVQPVRRSARTSTKAHHNRSEPGLEPCFDEAIDHLWRAIFSA